MKWLLPGLLMLAWVLGEESADALEGAADNTGHHVSVDANAYPWSSIGKLYNSIGGACTGVVIARDKVLTAAHCLFNARTGRFLPATSLHFLLGYERGTYRVHARVARYKTGPGYDPKRRAETLPSDWSVLTLAEPLPPDTRALALADAIPRKGMRSRSSGYGRDRRYVMTADMSCQVLGPAQGGRLFAHDCRSGALLLSDDNQEPARILGLNIAEGRIGGMKVRIAIPGSSIAQELATR